MSATVQATMSDSVIPINTTKRRDDFVVAPPAESIDARRVAPDPSDAVDGYLAIDMGRRRLSAGIVQFDGSVAVRDRVATPARSVWPAVTQLVRRVLAANRTNVRPIRVGVTVPGPIDRLAGAMKPLGLPMWHDFPAQREISNLIGLEVSVDTFGRGLGLAELWVGGLAEIPTHKRHAAILTIGDEVDGAIISRGALLSGTNGNLGQFGHLIVEPDGFECPCGTIGCLTAYGSTDAIERGTGRDLPRTPDAIIDRTGIMTARAVATIAATFDVTEVVLGGIVPTVFGERYFDALHRELNERSRLAHLADLRVRLPGARIGTLTPAAAIARRDVTTATSNSTS